MWCVRRSRQEPSTTQAFYNYNSDNPGTDKPAPLVAGSRTPPPSQEETWEAERASEMFTTAQEVHQTHDSNPDGEDPESGVVEVDGPGQKETGAPEASSLLGQVSPSKKPSLH